MLRVLVGVFFCSWFSWAANSSKPSTSSSVGSSSITLAWETAPNHFDPRYGTDANSQYLENLVHCSLVDFGPDGEVVPALAQKMTWVDKKHLKISLDDGYKFSDGTLVTSDTVAKFYQNLLFEKHTQVAPRKMAFSNVVKITQTGNEVSFYLSKPDASFVTNLVVGIIHPKFLGLEPLDYSSGKYPTCGMYTIESSSFGGIKLAKNAFSKVKTTADSIEIKYVHDESTRFAKLIKGEVDLIQNGLSFDKISLIEKNYPQFKVDSAPALKTTYLAFNFRDPLVSNLSIRKAIAMALDNDSIIKYIFKGHAQKAVTMLPHTNPFSYDKIKAYDHNLKEAEKILDEAGYKKSSSGIRFSLSLKTTANRTRVEIAKAIASQLNKIGIKVTVASLEWGRFTGDVEKGDVQMYTLSWVGFKDPDILRYAFSEEAIPPHGANRGFFVHKNLTKILNQALEETEFAKRKSHYDEAQQIVHDFLPYVFLFHENNTVVYNKSIQGFKLYADGRYRSLASTLKVTNI
jgi:peptide/nickel transport system substrate-binding protein